MLPKSQEVEATPPTFKQVLVAMHFLSIIDTLSPPMYHTLSPLSELPFCFAFGCGFV